MAKLDTLSLRVINVDAQCRFYCDVLGMLDCGAGRVGYSQEEVALQFIAADAPYFPQPSDLYWKIALSVPNIERACEQLAGQGVAVTQPQQFRDVGYLAKFTDPEGFTVELIDHWFEGDRPKGQHDKTRLGGGAHLSLVTLRIADITAVEPDILSWGMKPVSVQRVEPFGFTLHFYALCDETPPNPDLTAIENRTWIYQRPYTVLEIQHVDTLNAETVSGDASGYSGLSISGSREAAECARLQIRSS